MSFADYVDQGVLFKRSIFTIPPCLYVLEVLLY